jgi:hypothetical protein
MPPIPHHHSEHFDDDGFALPRTWRIFFVVYGVCLTIVMVASMLNVLVVAVPATILLVLITIIVPVALTLNEPSA